MRRLLACALLLACGLAAAQEPAPAPDKVPGLALPGPQKVRAGAGYLKVKAECAGAVQFDVESQWEDEGAEFKTEALADGLSVLVSVPCSAGVIRVTAVGLVEGKLTPFAKTTIEVEVPADRRRPKPAPKPEPAPEPGPEPPPAPKPAGGVHVVMVLDRAGDPKAASLADAKSLRDAIRAAGARPHVYGLTDAVVSQQGYAAVVKKAGGAPALFFLDEKGLVFGPQKLPATEAEILAALRAVQGGGK